jgi:cell division protein FtsI (penicillin-binding protein 3)
MHDRLRVFQLIVLIFFFGILARLFYWQIVRSQDLKSVAQAQYQRRSELSVSRGKIFTADGYPLAINQRVYTAFATPKTLDASPVRIAALLSPILFEPQVSSTSGFVSQADLEGSLLSKLSERDKNWVSLKHRVTKEKQEQIDSLKISGIGFDPEEIRYYPEGSMAAHLLGFVGNDDQGNPKGYFGVEGRFDLELKGKGGFLSQETDALGKPIAIGEFQRIETVAARDLTLTIRRDIQNFLEEKLVKGIQTYGAKSADAIILDSKTGKVLAMASTSSYDPGSFFQFDPSLYKNPTVADSYEPGSTFKVLIMAAAIDAGVITPETQCDDCGGPKTIGKYTIRTWNEKYYKDITMTDALAKSDNTAMMFVASKLGEEKMISTIHSFGFGQKTGIDLQDEASPSLRDDNKWGDIDVATASFGQGIAVTPIQLVTAVNALANKGVLLRPTIIDHVVAGDVTFTTKPKEIRRVVSEETARTVTEMMIGSAAHGDAKWALPKGYTIAGKTGTAQIAVGGHYDEERTIASFVGFAPAEDPKFTMLVRISEPQTSQWGSETAAPLWFSIARDLFIKLGIPPKH